MSPARRSGLRPRQGAHRAHPARGPRALSQAASRGAKARPRVRAPRPLRGLDRPLHHRGAHVRHQAVRRPDRAAGRARGRRRALARRPHGELASAVARGARRHVTPLSTVAFVGIAAAIGLGVSQFFDYHGVAVDAPNYAGSVGATAPAPLVGTKTAGSAHLWVLIPVAVAAVVLIIGAFRGDRRLAGRRGPLRPARAGGRARDRPSAGSRRGPGWTGLQRLRGPVAAGLLG